MSNSQLDDINEEEGEKALAKALGITVDELDELSHGGIETNESNEGVVYYYIEIDKENSSKEVLDKVMRSVRCYDNRDFVTAHIELENYSDDENFSDSINEEKKNKRKEDKSDF